MKFRPVNQQDREAFHTPFWWNYHATNSCFSISA